MEKTATPLSGPPERDFAACCEKETLNFPRKNAILLRSKSSFRDSRYWGELAKKHLSRYNLPKWSDICEADAMARWADILDVKYERLTNTGFDDFIRMNPNWPLMAWLGTCLEQADEG